MPSVLTASSEIAKLLQPFRDDFLFYAPRCLKIRTKEGGVHPFRLNKAQLYVHKKLEEQLKEKGKIRALVLKGRQQGMSTYVEGRFYWRTSLNFGKRAGILTHQQASTDALFEMTKRYHDECPAVMRPKTGAASAKELRFADLDSGYFVATAGSKGVGRGFGGVQYFHSSEAAFQPNAEEHFAGVMQAIPNAPGTEVIIESTANGPGNMFYEMWQDAEAGKGEYIAIFVPWFWQDEYRLPVPDGFVLDAEEAEYAELYGCDAEQMAWRRAKIRDEFRGDVDLFNQEYPATSALAFRRVAGSPLIDMALIEKARQCTAAEPRGRHLIGVDPAEYGDDDTGIAHRQGRVIHSIEGRHGQSQIETANYIARKFGHLREEAEVMVDCTGGYGSTIVDLLTEWGWSAHRVMFGEKATEDELYANRRTEIWCDMAAWYADSPCSIPDNMALVAQTGAPQYTYDSSRRKVLESKEKMRQRGVKSPDLADAVALTHAFKFPSDTNRTRGLDRGRVKSSWRT